MLDFKKYTSQIPYPIKEDFIEERHLVTKYGNQIIVSIFDEDEYKNQIKKHELAYNDILSRFRYDLAKELNIQDNIRRDDLIDVALEIGIINGFSAVFKIASLLVKLIK